MQRSWVKKKLVLAVGCGWCLKSGKHHQAQCFTHVKSGLDTKQLSIIWQSLQIETATEGGAEFHLVVNLGKAMPYMGANQG